MEEEKRCPHHPDQALRLMSVTERTTGGNTTIQEKYRCPVQGCGYTYTSSETAER